MDHFGTGLCSVGEVATLIRTLLHKGNPLPLAQGALRGARIGGNQAGDSENVPRETILDRSGGWNHRERLTLTLLKPILACLLAETT